MSQTRRPTIIAVTGTGIDVIFSDPDAEPARLDVPPHPFLQVLQNGKPVVGMTLVGPKDTIQVELKDTEATRELSVQIAPDAMGAVLRVRYVSGTRRRLRQSVPSVHVELEVDEFLIVAGKFTRIELEDALISQRITTQIDYDAMDEVASSEEGGDCVCATGIPAIPGEPEKYRSLVEVSGSQLIGIVPVHPVVSVLAGTAIAQWTAAKEGKTGVTVRGEPVPVRPVRTPLPKLGKGVREESGTILASRAGRVVRTARLLDVAETLVFEESHQLTDGHVMFDGDVVFKQDVADGVEVLAGGKVFVAGNVSHARISADQGILVSGGAVAATLRAGTKMVALSELLALFQALQEEIETLVSAVKQVEVIYAARGQAPEAGRILAKLLDDKFHEFSRWPAEFEQWRVTQGTSAGPEWSNFVLALTGQIQSSRLTTLKNVRGLEILTELLEQRIAILPDRNEGAEAWIQVRNAERSDLVATGDIVATGHGFYQCKVTSGSSVKAGGQPGVLLGCVVMAGTTVDAREIGSQAEVPTTVEIRGSDGEIKAKKIHPGTVLKAGSWQYKVHKDLVDVTWP